MPCRNLFSKERTKNFLFLGRERKVLLLPAIMYWAPYPCRCYVLFMYSLLYPHDTDPRWLFMSPCGLGTGVVGTQATMTSPNEGLFPSYATSAEKVPLTELALHGWWGVNEWTKEKTTAGTDLWSTDAQRRLLLHHAATLKAWSQHSCLSWPEIVCWLGPRMEILGR